MPIAPTDLTDQHGFYDTSVQISVISGKYKTHTMKRDIILAGVGGQGILSIATVIGDAALNEGLYLKQAEVHGMSQRGGDVQSNLRLSSDPIYSDLIPKGGADIIISLEPMEALRYLPYLKPEGWIVTSSKPFVNIPNYPDLEEIIYHIKALEHHVLVDVETLAKEAGAPAQAANMVLLGAAIPMLGIDHDKIGEEILLETCNRLGLDIEDLLDPEKFDEKELAEHNMLVDLGRNDIGRRIALTRRRIENVSKRFWKNTPKKCATSPTSTSRNVRTPCIPPCPTRPIRNTCRATSPTMTTSTPRSTACTRSHLCALSSLTPTQTLWKNTACLSPRI